MLYLNKNEFVEGARIQQDIRKIKLRFNALKEELKRSELGSGEIQRGLFVAIEGIDRVKVKKFTDELISKSHGDSFWGKDRPFPLHLHGCPKPWMKNGKRVIKFQEGTCLEPVPQHVFELSVERKWRMQEMILNNLKQGNCVIVSQYVFSDLAFALSHGCSRIEAMKFYDGMIKPDVVFQIPGFPEEEEEDMEKSRGFFDTARHNLKLMQRHVANWTRLDKKLSEKNMMKEMYSHFILMPVPKKFDYVFF